MTSYLERLQQSKDTKDGRKQEINAREAQVQLMKDTLDAERRKIAAESKLDTLKGTFPLNTSAILEAQYEAEAAENNFTDLLVLSVELFPEPIPVKAATASAGPKKATKSAK